MSGSGFLCLGYFLTMSGFLIHNFGDVCLSCRGHFLLVFGSCWDMFGDTSGRFPDRLGRVLQTSSEEVNKHFFFVNAWDDFPRAGPLKTITSGWFPDRTYQTIK